MRAVPCVSLLSWEARLRQNQNWYYLKMNEHFHSLHAVVDVRRRRLTGAKLTGASESALVEPPIRINSYTTSRKLSDMFLLTNAEGDNTTWLAARTIIESRVPPKSGGALTR